jgi:hypothetical protein
MPTLALTIPTTSHRTKWQKPEDSHLVTILLPSLRQTQDIDHEFRLYLGIDFDDKFYQNPECQEAIQRLYPEFSLKFMTMPPEIPKGHLTKMWNLLVTQAYHEGCDYFYLTGDDIRLTTPGWFKHAARLMKEHDDIGFTGPMNQNGKTSIITQTIVSRRHYEIFGYAFPEEIKNWYCDDWINLVYPTEYIYRMDEYHCYNLGGAERYKIVHAEKLCQEVAMRDRSKLIEVLK